MLIVLAVCPFVVSCAGDDDGQAAPAGPPSPAEPVTTPRELVAALQDERSAAFMAITGLTGTADGGPHDEAEVRHRTDAAIADLDAAAAGILDALSQLRSDIDNRPQPADLTQLPFANEVFDRYSEMVVGVLDAHRNEASEIEDPDVRLGVQLLSEGLRQAELVHQTVHALVVGVVAGGRQSYPEWITELSSLDAQLTRGQADLADLARGTAYEPAAEQLSADLEAADFLAEVRDVLGGAQPDLVNLLDSVTLPPDQGWVAFLDQVEDILSGGG